MSHDGWVALPHGATGLSAVCDCGISWSYSLTIFGRHILIALSVRPCVRPSRFRVRSISPIFFEIGIPNLVSGYILGWLSVAYHFRFTLTLTSDLVFRIIVSGAYLLVLYYLRYESQIWCVDASSDDKVSCTKLGHCDLELDLWPSF